MNINSRQERTGFIESLIHIEHDRGHVVKSIGIARIAVDDGKVYFYFPSNASMVKKMKFSDRISLIIGSRKIINTDNSDISDVFDVLTVSVPNDQDPINFISLIMDLISNLWVDYDSFKIIEVFEMLRTLFHNADKMSYKSEVGLLGELLFIYSRLISKIDVISGWGFTNLERFDFLVNGEFYEIKTSTLNRKITVSDNQIAVAKKNDNVILVNFKIHNGDDDINYLHTKILDLLVDPNEKETYNRKFFERFYNLKSSISFDLFKSINSKLELKMNRLNYPTANDLGDEICNVKYTLDLELL